MGGVSPLSGLEPVLFRQRVHRLTVYTLFEDTSGESTNVCAKLRFDRRIRLEFHGATITSDAGLLACRELDEALGLTETVRE